MYWGVELVFDNVFRKDGGWYVQNYDRPGVSMQLWSGQPCFIEK